MPAAVRATPRVRPVLRTAVARGLTALLAATGACAPAPDGAEGGAGSGGVVAAAQPLAARAGATMLDAGGNAADAAVAAAFTLAVVEPSMSGLGGRAQILLRTPDGALHGIDGTTQAPASYDPDTAPQADHGYPVIGVPGVPAALLRAHAEFGTLPLAQVMAPAIRHADEGFELLPGEARRHAAAAEELAAFPGSRAVFLQEDGTTRPAGARFRQPELATTLRAIAEGGADAFYRGEIARRIVDDVQANGGVLTLASLAEYRAETSTVLRDDYRGYETVGLAVPSFGAITLEILNLLEPFDLAAFSEARWAAVFAEAVRVAYLDRGEQYTAGDRARLISDAYAAERLDALRLPEGVRPAAAADAGAAPAPRLDGAGPAGRAVVAGARSAPLPARAEGGPATPPPPAWTEEVGHTTHLTAADGDGMVVALTQSLGPSLGSKVVTPGLGFVYASTLGGYLGRMEPGERAASHISPFLLLRDGQPVLGLGAAGGGRIIPAVVAVTSRIVDRGMSLEEALRAPRLYPATGSAFADPSPDAVVPVDVEVETGAGFSAAHLDSLTAFGFQVDPEPRSGRFGRVHAVYRPDPGAPWVGGADPDWEGSVATSPPGSGS